MTNPSSFKALEKKEQGSVRCPGWVKTLEQTEQWNLKISLVHLEHISMALLISHLPTFNLEPESKEQVPFVSF